MVSSCFHVFSFLFQARAFFQAAYVISPHMYEPHYNWAALADQVCVNFPILTSFSFPKMLNLHNLIKNLWGACLGNPFSRLAVKGRFTSITI